MHRQARIVATAGLAALVLSGCATFTDNDAAARVGDVELTRDDVAEVLADAPDGPDADSVRGVTGLFVANEVVKADLATLGIDLPEVDRSDQPIGDALREELDFVLQTWQSLPIEVLSEPALGASYNGGNSGLVCTSHILTDTEAEAEAAIAELEAGRPFAEVATELSTDAGSGANGGRLGCQFATDFDSTFVPEFVDGALPLEIDEVSGPVESSFGFHVITKIGYEQLAVPDVIQLRVSQFGDRYDIYVDPRIGAWSANGTVTPLG